MERLDLVRGELSSPPFGMRGGVSILVTACVPFMKRLLKAERLFSPRSSAVSETETMMT